jgi:acetyl esterase
LYARTPEQRNDWRAAFLFADLAGLPAAPLIIGRLDPLLGDSQRLGARLKEAAVPGKLTIYGGINHGFVRYGQLIATARRAIADCAAALGKAVRAR